MLESALLIAIVLGLAGTAFLVVMVRSMMKEFNRMHKRNAELQERVERDIRRGRP
jgi:multisubunit Na+/H+ antiporter MnhC subunit